MVNEELINNIKARFQQGERANEIREALVNEGWSDGDVTAAFAQIRHEAFLQIPIYAKIHDWMNNADKKAAELPTRTIVQIFIVIAVLFVGGVAALYYFLDPLGLRMAERDKQREDVAVELRLALENYHKDNSSYPAFVKQLVPKYLKAEPLDPKTNKAIEYKLTANNAHYEFCIDFEVQVVRCVTSDDTTSIPTAPEQQDSVPVQTSLQYAINGQVFFDKNGSGEKDDEEEASQIAIKITDSSGAVVCETSTDTSGIFNCNVNGQGAYIVTIVTPAGYASDIGNPVQINLPTTNSVQPNVETLFVGLIK